MIPMAYELSNRGTSGNLIRIARQLEAYTRYGEILKEVANSLVSAQPRPLFFAQLLSFDHSAPQHPPIYPEPLSDLPTSTY